MNMDHRLPSPAVSELLLADLHHLLLNQEDIPVASCQFPTEFLVSRQRTIRLEDLIDDGAAPLDSVPTKFAQEGRGYELCVFQKGGNCALEFQHQ